MKKCTRIKYGKEPTLRPINRWVVTVARLVGKRWHTRYFYCLNLDGVRACRDRARRGSVIEVYEAHHNFREGWISE